MHPQIDRLTTFPGVFPIKTPIYMATFGSIYNIQTHPYVRLHLQIILQYSTIILHDTCNIYLNMSKNILYQTLYGYKHLKTLFLYPSFITNQPVGTFMAPLDQHPRAHHGTSWRESSATSRFGWADRLAE